MARIHNFNAGPAALPLAVLERAQRELVELGNTGMSVMEHSHRGKAYDEIHNDAIARLKALLGMGDEHQVLFLQGGASLQFAMLPLNFLPEGKSADYVITGNWSKKAFAEAKGIGKARAAYDGYADGGCTRIPAAADLDLDPQAAYLHLTSNNTIFGTQYHQFPESKVPLVCDMSSDFLWKPLDVGRFDMIYAGAQKNVGPSGLVIVILRKSWLEQARADAPTILRYKTHADANSLYNTPNTFAIYMVRAVLEHLQELGGLPAVEKANRTKADLLYSAIDADADFFRCPVDKASRSTMNVVFRLPSEDLEKAFIAAATDKGLTGLKGHRSVGGIRASIYNAAPLASVEALVAFMREFHASH